jgi:hypothetical protein
MLNMYLLVYLFELTALTCDTGHAVVSVTSTHALHINEVTDCLKFA